MAVSVLWIAGLFLAGCGQTGNPLPPSLNLATQVNDLNASRRANAVHLQWTMPRRTIDKLALKGEQTVAVCRKLESGPCTSAGEARFPPEKNASYDDLLPPELTSGPLRLLTYSVQVRNSRGRDAGPSNQAFAIAGAAPPGLAGFSGEVTAAGVLLHWQPAPGASGTIQIHRTLLSSPAKKERTPKSPLGTGDVLPVDQALVVPVSTDSDPGRALDTDAAFDRSYRYEAYRVVTEHLGDHTIEIAGASSSQITVNTRDTFPPQSPADLAVVPVSDEGAIDLSWTPDVDPDLAGYIVYRRDSGDGTKPERISASTVIGPAFRDITAHPGHTYIYSVSAVDRDGNESARSQEQTATLEPKQ